MNQRRVFFKKILSSCIYLFTFGSGMSVNLKGWASWNHKAFKSNNFQKALESLYGSKKIETTDLINIKAPDVAENGLSVPISVSASINDIESLSIFVTDNPLPLVANYHLKKDVIPNFSVRVKVAKSTNIHVVVKSKDKLFSSFRKIKVTLSGCAED